MNELLKTIADRFGTDSETMIKSIFSGGASYGVGSYITSIQTFNWELEKNLVTIFWGALTCIILTILSSLISDLYKWIKKKIQNKLNKE